MGNIKLSAIDFIQLMQAVADGWNEGNARTPALPLRSASGTIVAGGAREAADCFSEDAIYVEPPDKQLYHGRAELFEFFGGDSGTDLPMKMTWHHLAFHEEDQVGFGEYTFQLHGRYHGIVVVKIEGGLIKQWREYQYRSELNWEEFASHNPF